MMKPPCRVPSRLMSAYVIAGGDGRPVHRAVDVDVAEDRAIGGDGTTLQESVDGGGTGVVGGGDARCDHRAVGGEAAQVYDLSRRVRERGAEVARPRLPRDGLNQDRARGGAIRDDLADQAAAANDLTGEPAVEDHLGRGEHGLGHEPALRRLDVDPAQVGGHLCERGSARLDRVGPDSRGLDGA